jgi:death on curing protein
MFANGYTQNIFELATSYLKSIALNHPFIDGNKRTGLLATLIFLDYNGYSIKENYKTELADLVLKFILKEISFNELCQDFEARAYKN